MEETNQQL
jgi:hypothetical protein